MHVICTAGHVDHGKSALVRALTGMEPDRLAEERRRSMTIDLGFAWCSLDSADSSGPWTAAFVDLPGHHRFIGNMLAGASPAAVTLLVVSADDGPMPQTHEHLEILDLLGVSHGLVAITKTDLVDDSTAEVAAELVREALAGTSLADAPVVPVSAVTGYNLDKLRETLLSVLAGLPAEHDEGRPRLWVDRSFSIRGTGTVITGTLRNGTLAIGDEVMVLPGEQTARIRGLQSLGRPVDLAEPGSRVAVNLAGIARGDVGRGDAIVLAGQWLGVRSAEAWVRALPGRAIQSRGDWHLHCGTGEWRVLLRTVSGRTIPAAGEGPIRLDLPSAAAVAPGDRFVLRESGRQITVGGGTVLDVAPGPAARGRAAREVRTAPLRRRLGALRSGDRLFLAVDHAQAHGVVSQRDLAGLAGLGADQSDAASDGRLTRLGSTLIDTENARHWRAVAMDAVRRYHADHPIERAAAKDIAVRAVIDADCPALVGTRLVADTVGRGELAAEGAGLRLPAHSVHLNERQSRAADRLLELLDNGGFGPPDFHQVLAETGAAEVVGELEAAGRMVRISPDLAMTARMLDRAHDLLREAFLRAGPLTASQARDALGTTRKYVLPLLAALDQRGCTRRQGDLRFVPDTAHHQSTADQTSPALGER
jgi:selenocysteine-specific elongation factor